MTDSPTQTLPRLGTECPTCGAHADPGQLVCLECGTRLALDYRRPRGWKAPLLVILLVLALAGAAFAIALIAVDDDSKDEVAASKAGKQAGAKPAAKPKPAKRPPAKSSPRPASSAGLASWPNGRNGFTVVLLAAGDRASALKFANDARRGGAKVGVLRTDDFSSLEKGFWLVFSGVYRSRGQARNASGRLGRRFSGAYPQFVSGARKR